MTGNRKIESGKRIVVKIGSALLADQENGAVHREWLAALAEDIAACIKRGQEVILVSSGAIAIGRRQLGLPSGPLKLDENQAAAATGMVIVSTMALAIMLTNEVLMPAWVQYRIQGDEELSDLSNQVRLLRRLSIVVMLALAFLFHILIDRFDFANSSAIFLRFRTNHGSRTIRSTACRLISQKTNRPSESTIRSSFSLSRNNMLWIATPKNLYRSG